MIELPLTLSDDQLDTIAEHVAAKLSERAANDAVRPAAYTVATLAQQLALSPRAIRGAIERGELAAVKRGGRWVIAAQAVAAWTEPQHEKTTRAPSPQRHRVRSVGATLADVVRSLDKADERR